jgi:transcriptional regulator with PAS, ATPase and Fis domain
MFEGELFGAEKGAYTGAYQQRTGLVEAAQEGTLFLNEIAEVPLTLQAKLLQLIEAREYRRLGSTEVQRYVGRIIAASNRNLPEEVRAGRFRDDLWYRLDVFSIRLPALREHVEDLELLAQALLERLAQSYGRPKPQIRPGDLQALRRHDFPGNVRELRNLLERSLLQTPAGSGWLEIDAAWVGSLKTPAPVQGPSAERDLSPLEARELAAIRQALRDAKGVVRRGAARLGISHSTLLRRIDRWPELRALLAPGQDEDLKGG